MAKQTGADGSSAGTEQQAGAGPGKFRHEVLEDCILDGMYRARGDIVHSDKETVPHCELIE
jgi:hypothetical protein